MLDLTGWQVFALVLAATVSLLGGRALGGAAQRATYRKLLLRRTTSLDDRFILRLGGPFQVGGIVLVWQLLVTFIELPAGVLAFCRNLGHIGLLLAIGWAALRLVDAGMEHVATRSTWIIDQRLSRALLPLARRLAKGMLVVLVGVMVLARVGYAVGPLLVVLAICGASLALAAHRPLENVLAAFAILGDHGIREGDHVTLDGGVTGTIEQIGLYSTRLRTATATHVIVPNRRLADAQIERTFHRPPTRPLGTATAPGVHPSSTAGGLS